MHIVSYTSCSFGWIGWLAGGCTCPGLGAGCWGGCWLPVGVLEGWGWWMEPEWWENDGGAEEERERETERERERTVDNTAQELYKQWTKSSLWKKKNLTIHPLLRGWWSFSLTGVLGAWGTQGLWVPSRSKHSWSTLEHRVHLGQRDK